MPNNILLTGRPGSGKTTLVMRLVEGFAADGFKAGGFITEEIREGPHRVGFEVRDLGGGTAILAHVGYKGKHRVGKYGVDVEAFERIALHALKIGKKEADLLVVDEIGRMELFSSTFRSTLLGLLAAPVPLLATVHAGKDDFSEDVLLRDDVFVFCLSPTQRENLLEVIDESMRRILTDGGISGEPEGGMGS
jgi:nucleoside-triphosphatase